MRTVGLLFPRINFLLASAIVSVVSGFVTLAVPLCLTLNHLLVTFAVYGISFGFYDTGCNVYLLQLWGDSASPFLQALQLMYGLGSLAAPLIAEPFLVAQPAAVLPVGGDDSDQDMSIMPVATETKLFYPYTILAILIFFNSIFFFTVWLTQENDRNPTASNAAADSGHNASARSVRLRRLCSVVIVILVLIFMHVYLGIEVSIGSFLLTYAVQSDLHLDKKTAAYLTSLFWLTFTFTKLAVALVVLRVGNEFIIWVSLILVIVSNLLLLLWSSAIGVTMGVALMGIGISGVFGCMFGYLQQQVTVTSAVASAIVVSATLGEFSFPFLISLYLDHYPDVLVWVSAAAALLMLLLFAAITVTSRVKTRFL